MYSVVGTCRWLGHDLLACMRDAFVPLPALPAGRLDDLLPDRAGRGGVTGPVQRFRGSHLWSRGTPAPCILTVMADVTQLLDAAAAWDPHSR